MDEHVVEVQPCNLVGAAGAMFAGEWMWGCFTCPAIELGLTFDEAEEAAENHREGR